jgi:hypothetical protein
MGGIGGKRGLDKFSAKLGLVTKLGVGGIAFRGISQAAVFKYAPHARSLAPLVQARGLRDNTIWVGCVVRGR